MLTLFATEPRLTVDDVAAALGVPKPIALAAVRALADAGHLERHPCSVGGTGLWRPAARGADDG